jgi:aryl-alcohol dehydrogenase-like predicted oxidoreductase
VELKFLGNTGIRVSPLCLGTEPFGGEADEAAASAIVRFCRDKGINFFDCADVYQAGRAEEILGRLIRDVRNDVVITSKVYFGTSGDVNDMGASRRHIMSAVERSLRRLGTDHIDIYFIHRFDDKTPLEETLRALDDLVTQGKILYPGASNFAAWQVEKALGLAAASGFTPFGCIQPMYNLVKRQAEVEILPMAAAERLGVIAYSPLGGGLLTGKYARGEASGESRLNASKPFRSRYGFDWMHEAARKFAEFARERGFDPAALAVAWAGSHPAVTAPIIAGRGVDQIRGSVGSLDIAMTPVLRAEISALSPEPPPATDRTEERTSDNFGVR